MILRELIEKTSIHNVFGDVFDNATQDDLVFYFETYEVCGDNFIHFLQRKEKLLKDQYDKYLTIEAEELNPLVTQYMHIVHDNEKKDQRDFNKTHTGYDNIQFGHTNTASGTDQNTHGLTVTRTGSESNTDTTVITRTGSETDTDTTAITRTGSESTDDTTTIVRSGSETTEDTTHVTRTGSETDADTTYVQYTGSESVKSGGDTGALSAMTPPVAAATMDGFMGPIDGSSQGSQFESGVTSQSLTRARNESETTFDNRKDQKGGNITKTFNSVKDQKGGDIEKTYNDVTDEHSGGITKTYNSVQDTHSGSITKTFNNVADTHSGGITKTYNNVADAQSGTDSITHGRTDTESGTNTANYNDNIRDYGGNTRTEDLDETRQGYDGVPAELLGKARNYIINTNSFKWLVTELLTCFMDIMEY